MAFVISVSRLALANVVLWECVPCGHHVVQEGSGCRFPVTISTRGEDELVQLVITAGFVRGSLPQEYADSKRFFCPVCRKELHETQPRAVTMVRDPGATMRYRVEIEIELSCLACMPRPRRFHAAYCRGDTDVHLTEVT